MNIEKLRKLAERNEVALFDRGGRKRTPPYYYDSLRHAFGFYFNTFNTQNVSYDFYALGLSDRDLRILKGQILDEDNTVLAIVAFERFFELFIKDLLRRVDRRLIYAYKGSKKNGASEIITNIRNKTNRPSKFDKKYLLAPFRESLNRFYGLITLLNSNYPDPIVKKFRKVYKDYCFLDSTEFRASLELISWYRDRILHNGNRLPSMWFLDYMMTQRLIPIVKMIIDVEKKMLGESLFYLKSVTNIDILEKLSEVKFDFKELNRKDKIQKIYNYLLYIGHLKEIGRANMNMNLFMRSNYKATYEYNYSDPKGRAKRFAEAERNYQYFKEIKQCPCCGEETLVLYRNTIPDLLNIGKLLNIDWVKCYMCDYHLRYNVGDPKDFELIKERIFTE